MDNQELSILQEAFYFLENKTTIRKTANFFNVSKSLVHYHFSKKLKSINNEIYLLVKHQLDNNFNQKHIRGGYAVKIKALKKCENIHNA